MNSYEFQVNLISNVGHESSENTLSSFTNIISPPLFLNDSHHWSCGLADLYIGKFSRHYMNLNKFSKDALCLNQINKEMYIKGLKLKTEEYNYIFTIKNFCNYLKSISIDPKIYSRKYFQNYSILDYHFDIDRWKMQYKDDIVQTKENDTKISFKFNLSELLEPNESIETFIPLYDAFKLQRGYFVNTVITFIDSQNYRLIEILNVMIRHLILKLKIEKRLSEQYIRSVYAQEQEQEEEEEEEENIASFSYPKMEHQMDKLISRFVNLFIEELVYNENIPNEMIYPDVEIIMIYCSIISEVHTGNSKSKVIKIVPFDFSKNIFNFPNVTFHPIAVNTISQISILITDLYGKQLKFIDSYTPTSLTLTFKRKM